MQEWQTAPYYVLKLFITVNIGMQLGHDERKKKGKKAGGASRKERTEKGKSRRKIFWIESILMRKGRN